MRRSGTEFTVCLVKAGRKQNVNDTIDDLIGGGGILKTNQKIKNKGRIVTAKSVLLDSVMSCDFGLIP